MEISDDLVLELTKDCKTQDDFSAGSAAGQYAGDSLNDAYFNAKYEQATNAYERAKQQSQHQTYFQKMQQEIDDPFGFGDGEPTSSGMGATDKDWAKQFQNWESDFEADADGLFASNHAPMPGTYTSTPHASVPAPCVASQQRESVSTTTRIHQQMSAQRASAVQVRAANHASFGSEVLGHTADMFNGHAASALATESASQRAAVRRVFGGSHGLAYRGMEDVADGFVSTAQGEGNLMIRDGLAFKNAHGFLGYVGAFDQTMHDVDMGLVSVAGGEAVGVVAGGLAAGLFGRIGLVDGEAAEEILSPHEQLDRALEQSKVYEQLDRIQASNPNAASALRNKLSGLSNAQKLSEKVEVSSDGSLRYYQNFRPARTPGPTSGARFVIKYNPKTGDLTMWNENYDSAGVVNRISLKSINGFEVSSPHFPPTLRETLDQELSSINRLRF